MECFRSIFIDVKDAKRKVFNVQRHIFCYYLDSWIKNFNLWFVSDSTRLNWWKFIFKKIERLLMLYCINQTEGISSCFRLFFFSFLNSNADNNAMLQAILLLNPPKLDLNQTMKITQWDIKNFSCKMIKMISFLSCKYFYILIYMPWANLSIIEISCLQNSNGLVR